MEGERIMESPQLKGVVIITLPPLDNPSFGKTITAFTLSDTVPSPLQEPQQPQQQQQQDLIPIRSSQNPDHQFFSFKIFFFGSPRILLGFLGISLLAIFLWNSVSSGTLLESRNSDDDREFNSFIFTLHPKMGNGEMSKLDVGGRFVERDRVTTVGKTIDDGGKNQKICKLVSSVSAVDSSTNIPVRGNVYPDGMYYTSMLVGNPPRPYYLDMDTGSDLTWIQCDAPCTSCAKGPNPLYKPTTIVPSKDLLCVEVQTNEKSKNCESCRQCDYEIEYGDHSSKDSLFVEVQTNEKSKNCESCRQCDYEIEYGDHSSTMGVLARDELQLMFTNGTLIKPSVVFGCAYDQQGKLLVSPAKTDGILGLSRAKASLPSQLASKGIIHNVVGHCITSDVRGGGYMFLGHDFIPDWGMAWVPMLNSPSINFYHTRIVKLSYGGGQLSLGGLDKSVGRVVFDSGSSYTYLTKQAYSGLVASLEDVSKEGLIKDESDSTLPVCWRSKSPIRSVKDVKPFFKPLTLQFESRWIASTKLRIPPEGYLIISVRTRYLSYVCLKSAGTNYHFVGPLFDDGIVILQNKGNVCLGILDGSEVHDGMTIILGDISLRGQLIVYDNVNQKIGWAPSDCVEPRRFKSFPFF
ncbi:hypothetical protein HHK36_006966 [Tetracentron sinense]|uniref:Peptidase A1 domain-containing protein n=1 Tax=Tetracentron sinense TaxID=13715 RepID=A0A834ZLU8_TETSI|nr:hypothetical protein HHK36_006966 [Tetracentron sinense]